MADAQLASREEVLNVRLADLLCKKGLRARPELILKAERRQLPDILVDVEGVRVIIEGRSNSNNLLADVTSRVTSGIAPVALGVLYPKSVREAADVKRAMTSASFDVDVVYFDRDGLRQTHQKGLTLDGLVQTIYAAHQIQVKDDLTIYHVNRVREAIDEAVREGLGELSAGESLALAAHMSERLDLHAKGTSKKLTDELLRIALFVLFDAMIFHGVVAQRHPDKVKQVNALTRNGRRNFLIDNWDQILEIDFEPLFRLSRDLLDVIPNSSAWNGRLDRLAQVAANVRGSGVLAKHDFMGRLFHKILLRTSGEAYATYYTAIPSAYVLARLAVGLSETKFTDIGVLNDYRAGDLACGSGTLLSAAYTAVRDKYVADSHTPLDLGLLHEQLVEHCLYGLDVLDYAAHLTLTTLALHNSEADINGSNIFAVPVGVQGNVAYLGSLDLYLESLTGLAFDEREMAKSIAGDRRARRIDLPEFDLLIMNPPFSRSSGPKVSFAYETKTNKPKLQAKMKRIAKEQGFHKMLIAGMGSLFVPLALKYSRMGGRIAFVLPRALLSGVAWEEVREHVTKHCHLEVVVSNHDPGYAPTGADGKRERRTRGWAFSEETDIGEVLFIARKRGQREANEHTRFVNIFEFPANEYEAIAMADQVIDMQRADGDGDLEFNNRVVGTTFLVEQQQLEQYNWLFPCVFASRDLDDLAMALIDQPGLVRFDSLVTSYGCDISAEKGMFGSSNVRTSYPVLWTHGISQNTLALDQTQVGFGSPLGDRARASEFFKAKAGRLLIAERPHLKTTPTFAFVSDRDILATPFWECRLKNESLTSIIAMWLNSTYGIILTLTAATSSQGEIFKLKQDQLRRLRVLDPTIVDQEKAGALWRHIAHVKLDNMRTSWIDAARGVGPRLELDRFFAPYMKRRLSVTDYELLATEPVVTHRRR